MSRILLIAAGVIAAVAVGTWFLSTRPILFTRLFVPRDDRPLVRREIMEGNGFQNRMRLLGTIEMLIAAACAGGAYALRH